MRNQVRSQRRLAEIASRQHGVVSGRQPAEIGCSKEARSRASAAGRLHRLHRDVYAVGHTAITRHGHALAAVLAYGDGTLLSHRSAAWLWGMTKRWGLPVEVTTPAPQDQRACIRAHSARTLTEGDKSSFEGIPVTAVPRTLLDFAAVDPHFLRHALARAEQLGLLDLISIDTLLARSRGLRGVARLRVTLEVHRIPRFQIGTRASVSRAPPRGGTTPSCDEPFRCRA